MRLSLYLTTGLLATTLALASSCMFDPAGLAGFGGTPTSASEASSSGSTASAGGEGGGGGGTSASSTTGVGGAGGSSSVSSSSSAASSTGTGGGSASIMVAGELLVDLDVNDATAGTGTWHNKGALGGDFKKLGNPAKGMSANKAAVLFDGNDGYYGPLSTATIEGKSDRSIELWVVNPVVSGTEESMISWANRENQATGRMMGFNYGKNLAWSAVNHWNQADMAWGPSESDTPPGGQWHHLAYTYDGSTAIVFADGMKKAEKVVTLDTKAGFSINIAVQRNGTTFEFNGSLDIAVVRIHSKALSPAEVKLNYDAEKSRFQ